MGFVSKTAKDHLRLLPIAKWTETAMRGKVLHDVVYTVAVHRLRKVVDAAGRPWSPNDLWGKSSSLMRFRNGPSLVLETLSRQCGQRFEGLGITVAAKVDAAAWCRDVLGLRS